MQQLLQTPIEKFGKIVGENIEKLLKLTFNIHDMQIIFHYLKIRKKINGKTFHIDYQTVKLVKNNREFQREQLITRVINPDGTNKTIVFDHRTITVYDENGHRKAYILDGYDRITKVVEYNNDPVLGLNFEVDQYNTTYSYDTVDNLVNITDALGNIYTFSYDSLGRRIALSDPDLGNWTYTYDLVGNLITQKQVGGGNLVSGDGFYREYDGLNQLIRIRNGSAANSGQIENYTYDPFGQRIKIMRNDSAKTIIYTPFKELMQIRNTSGIFNFTYVYQDDVLVARVDPKNNKTFYHPDHLGSTVLITNASGRIVENTFYSPFGEVLGGGKSDVKLYTGQFKDLSCEYYYGARYYNPCIGQFIQPDTLIQQVYNPQSLNHYSYGLNNPYRYKDDTGQIPIDTVFDIAFIGYDLYTLATQGVGENNENLVAFGLDVGGAAIPYATGLGKAYKAGKLADRAVDTTKAIDKATNVAKTTKNIPNPFGSKGGLAHQAEVNKIAKNIESRGLEPVKEFTIKDPITGKTRRADVVGRDPLTKEVKEIHQVGKETKLGNPISRERKAIIDVENAIKNLDNFLKDVEVQFHKYIPKSGGS